MIDALLSWQTFVAALLVFGFAPRAVLRIVVLAFHRDDPRRDEILAEINAVPRFERPFWVFEQLEVAIAEGVRDRIWWAAAGRITHRWHLESGVESNREYPVTFWIPSEEAKRTVHPGVLVKLNFQMRDGLWWGGRWGERMWVIVKEVDGDQLVGELNSQPWAMPKLFAGDEVKFRREHIIDVDFNPPQDDTCDVV